MKIYRGHSDNTVCGNEMVTNRRAYRASRSVSLNLLRTSIAAVLFLSSLVPGKAEPAPVIHYAPGENLEHVDVDLIDRAEHEIDMAAYVLTDWPVMQALTRAADRGVLAAGSNPVADNYLSRSGPSRRIIDPVKYYVSRIETLGYAGD